MSYWHELENKYYMPTFTRMPVTVVRGQGAWVWDENGKKYLDFINGLAVNVLGHCHPAVTAAISEQAGTLVQTSNLMYTVPQLKLAKLLVANSCMDRVFLCNSGTEANEGAVKLARRWGKMRLNGAYEVITTFNSFHGRTLAMVAATGQRKMQEPYEPLPEGFRNVPFNDIEEIRQATTAKTCAIMLEPIQAEGGVNVPDTGYLPAVREWCDAKGLLLIFDEVQTGMGRLGTLFGYEQTGIEPDVMTLAKGMANGVPIGALLCKEKASVFAAGEHGSTFGGNALACAAAFAVLSYILDNNVPQNAAKVGEYFKTGLTGLKDRYHFVVDVRGRGLLLAMEFNREIGQSVTLGCLKNGLLVNKLKPNAIRLIPPLIITVAEVDEALAVMNRVLGEHV